MSVENFTRESCENTSPVPWMLHAGDQSWTQTLGKDVSDKVTLESASSSTSTELHLASTGEDLAGSAVDTYVLLPAVDVRTLALNDSVAVKLQQMQINTGRHVGLEVALVEDESVNVVESDTPLPEKESDVALEEAKKVDGVTSADMEEMLAEPEINERALAECENYLEQFYADCQREETLFLEAMCKNDVQLEDLSATPAADHLVPVSTIIPLVAPQETDKSTQPEHNSSVVSPAILTAEVLPTLVLLPVDKDLEKGSNWWLVNTNSYGPRRRRQVSLQILPDSRLKITFQNSTVPAIRIPLCETLIEIPTSRRPCLREKSRRRLTIFHDAARLKLMAFRKDDRDRLVSRLAEVAQQDTFF